MAKNILCKLGFHKYKKPYIVTNPYVFNDMQNGYEYRICERCEKTQMREECYEDWENCSDTKDLD